MLFPPEQVTGRDTEGVRGGKGYYRLALAGEETECIGYHATPGEVQARLRSGRLRWALCSNVSGRGTMLTLAPLAATSRYRCSEAV